MKYWVRVWRTAPGLLAVAVAALALGVGANTTIFSVVEAVLLRPLPYRDAEQLVQIFETAPKKSAERYFVSPSDFFEWQDRSHTLDHFAYYWRNEINLTETGHDPERIPGIAISAGLIEALGVQPILGRLMRPEEGTPGGASVALISEPLWKRRFGADPAILGKSVGLNGELFTVIGILPEGLRFGGDAEVWSNLQLSRRARPRFLEAIARLRPHMTLADAQREMDQIANAISIESPASNNGWGVAVRTLPDVLLGDTRPALLVLFLSVGLLLLIACANVANLLLAQAAARQREVAIRAALGAGAGRLARQFFTESILLAAAGGGGGLLLANLGVDAVRNFGVSYFPRIQEVAISWPVLFYALGMTLLTGLLFGMAPVFRLWKPDLVSGLKDGGKGATDGAGEQRRRDGLVIAQVTLAVVLATSAGLLIKSFGRLTSVDPGFQTERILTANIPLARAQYSKPELVTAALDRLLESVGSLPGIVACGTTTSLPLEKDLDYRVPFHFLSSPAPGSPDEQTAWHRMVSPGFFQAMGTRLVEGRHFNETDRADSKPVAIVNETLARRYWPQGSAIGQKLHAVTGGFGPLGRILVENPEIVGVVADVRYSALGKNPEPAIYFVSRQAPFNNVTLVIRTKDAMSTEGLIAAVRRSVREIDPNWPVAHVRTMTEQVAESVARPRFQAILLAAFSGLALLLGAVGIYGVLSYSVVRRTREIGIRSALGGKPGDIQRMFLNHGLRLVGYGIALGLLLSLAAGSLLEKLLFDVRPADMPTYAVVCGALATVGILAGYLPARTASRIDPNVALRVS